MRDARSKFSQVKRTGSRVPGPPPIAYPLLRPTPAGTEGLTDATSKESCACAPAEKDKRSAATKKGVTWLWGSAGFIGPALRSRQLGLALSRKPNPLTAPGHGERIARVRRPPVPIELRPPFPWLLCCAAIVHARTLVSHPAQALVTSALPTATASQSNGVRVRE